MLISCDDGVGKGSGRSVPGFNLFEAMKSCGDIFTKYGGHELAAGFTVSPDKIAQLDDALNDFADKNMPEDAKTPSVTVECELPAKYITVEDILRIFSLRLDEREDYKNIRLEYKMGIAETFKEKQTARKLLSEAIKAKKLYVSDLREKA